MFPQIESFVNNLIDYCWDKAEEALQAGDQTTADNYGAKHVRLEEIRRIVKDPEYDPLIDSQDVLHLLSVIVEYLQ